MGGMDKTKFHNKKWNLLWWWFMFELLLKILQTPEIVLGWWSVLNYETKSWENGMEYLRLNLTQFEERRTNLWRKSKRKKKRNGERERPWLSKIKMKNKEWFIDYLRATTPTKLPIERERLKEEYGAIIKNKKGRNRFLFFFFSFSLVRNKKKREKKRKKKFDQITRKKNRLTTSDPSGKT